MILSREDVTARPLNLRKRFGSTKRLVAVSQFLCNRFKWNHTVVWDRKSLYNHFVFPREAFQRKEHEHRKLPASEATPELRKVQKYRFLSLGHDSVSYRLLTLKGWVHFYCNFSAKILRCHFYVWIYSLSYLRYFAPLNQSSTRHIEALCWYVIKSCLHTCITGTLSRRKGHCQSSPSSPPCA